MNKLSKMKSLGEEKNAPDFFQARKEEFLRKGQDMGLDLFKVQDFIEEKGIPEMNMELVLDYINNPSYVNPLKKRGL